MSRGARGPGGRRRGGAGDGPLRAPPADVARRRRAWRFVVALPLAWLVLAAAGLAVVVLDPLQWGPVDRRRSRPVGADDCARCHPREHASWAASYHRSMTARAAGTAQAAGADRATGAAEPADAAGALHLPSLEITHGSPGHAPKAPFAGETLRAAGFIATMDRDGDGRPQITIRRDSGRADAGELILQSTVELTVGSHHYQQYVGRPSVAPPGSVGPGLWRLPVAWHLGEQRWIAMNAAFLEPETPAGDAAELLRHLNRWNDNCLFCHNTAPAPGLGDDGEFRSRVAELGIACEACHGPASAHVTRHANPLRRIAAGTLAAAGLDATIARPAALAPARADDVCGRCHGQRIGRSIARILREGDGFLPGEDLSRVSRPIQRDSTLAGTDGAPFAARFWPDGTPRLSAYEYQGTRMSACAERGTMGCGSCHTMHGEDPVDQLRPGPASGPCRDCHRDLSEQHAGAGGVHDGVDCLDCHMPRITYGLLQGLRSHRVSVPEPGRWIDQSDMPDACTQCHVDRSRAWAAAGVQSLWGGEPPVDAGAEANAGAGAHAPAQVELDLLGGDPVQRALAVVALGAPAAAAAPAWRASLLAHGLDDPFPAVRWMARVQLRELGLREGWSGMAALAAALDPLVDRAERAPFAQTFATAWAAARGRGWPALPRPQTLADEPATALQLRAAAEATGLWIGE